MHGVGYLSYIFLVDLLSFDDSFLVLEQVLTVPFFNHNWLWIQLFAAQVLLARGNIVSICSIITHVDSTLYN